MYPAVWLWPLSVYLGILGGKSEWGKVGALNQALVHYYIPALVLAFLGCFPRFRPGPPLPSRTEETFLPRPWLRGLTIGILLFAVLLRVWWVWYWPPPGGMAYEEAQLGGTGWTLLHGWVIPPDDRLSVHAVALSLKIFGPSIFAARLPVMFMGLLCPALLLAVCRKLVSWEVSLFAVLLFSVSWWNLATERLADEVFFLLSFEVMIMWLLLHVMDTGRLWATFFLAFISGLLLYEQTAFHLVPILILGYLVIAAIAKIARLDMGCEGMFSWREVWDSLRTYGSVFLLILVVWTTTSMPRIVGDFSLGEHYLVEAFVRHGGTENVLTNRKVADAPAFVVERVKRTLQAAYKPGFGESVSWFSVGAYPMYDRATVLAGAVAVFLIALTFWRRFHALMLVWIFAPLIVGSVSAENPWFARFHLTLAPFYVAIGLGAGVLWGFSRRRSWRWLLLVLFGIVSFFAVVANINHFFFKVCRDPEVRRAFDDPNVILADWMGHREPDSATCLVTREYPQVTEHPDLTWLLRGRQARSTESVLDCLVHPFEVSGPIYFVIVPETEREQAEELIRRYHPGAEPMEPLYIGGGRADAMIVRVPGEPSRYSDGGSKERIPVR